jgi:hypothetical protein
MNDMILQAVARGWCAPENAHKEMDAALAEAIAREVSAALAAPPVGGEVGRLVGKWRGMSKLTSAELTRDQDEAQNHALAKCADQLEAALSAPAAPVAGDADLRAAIKEYRDTLQAFANDGRPEFHFAHQAAEQRLDAILAAPAPVAEDKAIDFKGAYAKAAAMMEAATPPAAEPVGECCEHANTRTHYEFVSCLDCRAIKTDSAWGVASNRWFASEADALFYRKHGRLPESAAPASPPAVTPGEEG